MCMHIPRPRHQFPPLCPVLLSVLGIGWWVTLAPCVHHHIWGGGRHWDSTQASESCLLAHTLSAAHGTETETANTLQWWPVWQGYSWHNVTWLSRGRVLSLHRHIILPGQRSRHYPDKIISDIWIAGWCIKWRCSVGNYSSELIRCAILLNVTLPVLWNDVTPETCQTL